MNNMILRTTSIISFLFILNSVLGQTKAELRVNVDNIKTMGKDIYAAAYKSQDDFNKDVAVAREKVSVNDSVATLVFHLPADSIYSIAIFQDVDGNGRLTTKGMMKAPDEPIGFSNNKLARFGPPNFNEVSFKLEGDTVLIIHIINSRKEFYRKVGLNNN